MLGLSRTIKKHKNVSRYLTVLYIYISLQEIQAGRNSCGRRMSFQSLISRLLRFKLPQNELKYSGGKKSDNLESKV